MTHIPSNGMKFESAILIYMISFTCARCVCKYGEWTDVLHTCIFYVCKWFFFLVFIIFARAERLREVRGLKNRIYHIMVLGTFQKQSIDFVDTRFNIRTHTCTWKWREQQRQHENFFAMYTKKLLTTLQIFIRCALVGACLWLSISRHVWIWI